MQARSRLVGRAAPLVALIFVVAGCGGDDGESSPASAPADADLTVTAFDIGFVEWDDTSQPYTADAGDVKIFYANDGSLHTLLVETADGSTLPLVREDGASVSKLQVNQPGTSDVGTVALEAGEYTIYCDIPGHRQAGMEAPLVVA